MDVKVAKTEKVDCGITVTAPAANPSGAIQEQMRREEMRDRGAVAAAASAPADSAVKNAFLESNTGFFIAHHANLEYPMRCMVPNIRGVDFFPAKSSREEDVAVALKAAQRRVKTLSKDPRLKNTIHNIVPANFPHLIPFSEATARTPTHTLPKINRNANRHVAFNKYRQDEFAKHAEVEHVTVDQVFEADGPVERKAKEPSEVSLSEYNRCKTYLSKRRTLKLSSADAAPTVAPGDEVTAAEALRASAATGRAIVERIMQSAAPEAAAAVAIPAPPRPGFRDFMSLEKAPDTVLEAEEADLPVAGAGAAPEEADDDKVVAEWPRDLERRAKFMNIAIVDDLDIPEDSPEFPGAAGMEPIVILFGGIYETEEEAIRVNENEIAPWCQDLKVDTVCLYEFLFPTEVDPDKIKEGHRTGNADYDSEMKLVMDQNKHQKSIAGRARQESAANNVRIPETNANAHLPDVDEVVERSRAAVSFAGDVVQLPRQTPVIQQIPEL